MSREKMGSQVESLPRSTLQVPESAEEVYEPTPEDQVHNSIHDLMMARFVGQEDGGEAEFNWRIFFDSLAEPFSPSVRRRIMEEASLKMDDMTTKCVSENRVPTEEDFQELIRKIMLVVVDESGSEKIADQNRAKILRDLLKTGAIKELGQDDFLVLDDFMGFLPDETYIKKALLSRQEAKKIIAKQIEDFTNALMQEDRLGVIDETDLFELDAQILDKLERVYGLKKIQKKQEGPFFQMPGNTQA